MTDKKRLPPQRQTLNTRAVIALFPGVFLATNRVRLNYSALSRRFIRSLLVAPMIICVVAMIVTLIATYGVALADETNRAELHKLVDALSGHWTIAQTNADATTAKGEEVWYVAPGGTPLIEEYRVTTSKGKEIADYASIWWGVNAKQYQGIWCADFTDEGCTPSTVQWIGSKLEMRGQYSVHGNRFNWREIVEVTSHDSFTQTLDIGPVRGELKLHGTVLGTRRLDSPTPREQP